MPVWPKLVPGWQGKPLERPWETVGTVPLATVWSTSGVFLKFLNRSNGPLERFAREALFLGESLRAFWGFYTISPIYINHERPLYTKSDFLSFKTSMEALPSLFPSSWLLGLYILCLREIDLLGILHISTDWFGLGAPLDILGGAWASLSLLR